jgi:hypothetical protein
MELERESDMESEGSLGKEPASPKDEAPSSKRARRGHTTPAMGDVGRRQSFSKRKRSLVAKAAELGQVTESKVCARHEPAAGRRQRSGRRAPAAELPPGQSTLLPAMRRRCSCS